jgi:hypothetical protein
MTNAYKILAREPASKSRLRDPEVDGRIILK